MSETRKIGLEDAFTLATRHQQAGRPEVAERIYRKILDVQPDNAAANTKLGRLFQDQGKPDEAIACYRRFIEIKPDHAKAHFNLGTVLYDTGKLDEAIACYRRAIEIKPDYTKAHHNLGKALQDEGKLDEAIVCYKRALEIDPDLAKTHNNLGHALGNQRKTDDAVACFRRAMEINPDYASAHFNYSLALLTLGEFTEGWVEHEWRWKREDPKYRGRGFAQPLWDGSRLDRRTILVHAEQGLGDAIQFIRYVPLVERRGGRVVVECKPQLVDLFSTMSAIDEVIARGDPLPAFDVYAPLMSLPHIFQTTAATIPGDVPYLAAPPEAGPGLPDCPEGTRLRVGISWAGSRINADDRTRSCRLSQFEPLWSIPGVAFFSLQYDEAAAELADSAGAVRDLGGRLGDFAVTAAIIERLDLVISVDTAVVHLAGALGKPVWVLIPFAADWRWMLDREDTPWYPTMRLFRQPALGDWASVFARVAGELGREAAGRG